MISDKPLNINVSTTSSNTQAGKPAAGDNDSGGGKVKPELPPAEVKTASGSEVPIAKDSKSVQGSDPAPSVTSLSQQIANARKEEVKEKVNEAIPKVRELLQKNQRSLDFKVAEEENRVIITVIDKETERVIRQIPPEDLLQIAESIDQGASKLAEGAILNFKA